MRSFDRAHFVTAIALKLGVFHIVGARTVGAAVLLRGWNQAPARLVSAFAQGFCILRVSGVEDGCRHSAHGGLLPSIQSCELFDAIQSPGGKFLKALDRPHREVVISSRIREVRYILFIRAGLHRHCRNGSPQAMWLWHARRVREIG
jgi:hypothetical protein